VQPEQGLKRVEQPGFVVLSGPETQRAGLEHQIKGIPGLRLVEAAVMADGRRGDHSHGLPSHTDPLTASAAGHPNSGHTPGTPHPATLKFLTENGVEERENPLTEHHGKDYEPDPRISFVEAEIQKPEHVNVAQAVAAQWGWVLRQHVAPIVRWVHEESVEELMTRVNRDMAALRRLAG
jgi:hypothetical protein